MWGQKVYEKFLYFSLNFAGNQKLLFLKKGRVGGSFKEKLKKNFFFFKAAPLPPASAVTLPCLAPRGNHGTCFGLPLPYAPSPGVGALLLT